MIILRSYQVKNDQFLNEEFQIWKEIHTFSKEQCDLNVDKVHLGYEILNGNKIVKSLMKKDTNDQNDVGRHCLL